MPSAAASEKPTFHELLHRLPRLKIEPIWVPLREFTLFPKFPREIRNRIWEFAAHEPRTVKLVALGTRCTCHIGTLFQKIACMAPPHFNRKYPTWLWNSNFEGQRRHPGILHACVESREEGLRYYVPHKERPRGNDVANTVFINYNADTFLMLQSALFEDFWPDLDSEGFTFNLTNFDNSPNVSPNLDNIQRLAIVWNTDILGYWGQTSIWLHSIVGNLDVATLAKLTIHLETPRPTNESPTLSHRNKLEQLLHRREIEIEGSRDLKRFLKPDVRHALDGHPPPCKFVWKHNPDLEEDDLAA